MFVKEVKARAIKNSRGERSVEVILKTYKGTFKASAPSGKSRGKHEVAPYHARGGFNFSMKMLHAFCKKLKHQNFMIKKFDDLKMFVTEMRKFEARHGRFGGNVDYVLEAVFLKAAAKDVGKELWEFIFESMDYNFHQGRRKKVKMPMPVGNCIGGGKHSSLIRGKKPDFQEFLLIPTGTNFSKAVTKNIRAYEYAKKLLGSGSVNDENAWMTDKTNEEVLFILKKVRQKYGVRLGLDVAASSFYKDGYYNYKNKSLIRDKVDQADYIERLVEKFGLFYVEDPIQEEDFSGFVEISNALKKKKTLIVGDDLTVTALKRLRRAVASKAINAIIVKPNQCGSLIEVRNVADFCKRHKIAMVFSHRSGETMDDTLADLAVGFQGEFIKAGLMGRERLIKLKRVMDIEKSVR